MRCTVEDATEKLYKRGVKVMNEDKTKITGHNKILRNVVTRKSNKVCKRLKELVRRAVRNYLDKVRNSVCVKKYALGRKKYAYKITEHLNNNEKY